MGFIWYHLFDAASTYNLIRVFVSSYVWMTGFGNFIFFQSKQDFSALRIVKVCVPGRTHRDEGAANCHRRCSA